MTASYQWIVENRLLIADGFGYLALFVYILALQAQTVKRTSLLYIPMDLSYAAHFFLLGALTGGVISILGAIRDVFVVYSSERILSLFIFAHVVLVWGVSIGVSEQTIDYLPTLATTCATIGMMRRERFIFSRLMVYLATSLWLVYFVILGSIPGVIGGCIILISNTVSLIRYIKTQKEDFDQDDQSGALGFDKNRQTT